MALPLSLILKFAVLVLAVPFLMLQWGYTWPDIREWYRQLFFGLHIGNTEVTFGALLASTVGVTPGRYLAALALTLVVEVPIYALLLHGAVAAPLRRPPRKPSRWARWKWTSPAVGPGSTASTST